MGVKARYYYVFNAEDIEGIPQLQSNEKTKIEISQLVEKISENMKVPIVHKSVEDPYYSLPEDTIYMPYPEQFANAYEYNAAALHEEAHATGVESRLNRDTYLDYAKEELVAEITAAFMAQHVQEELTSVSFTDQDMQNHMAYVQSWISSIRTSQKPYWKQFEMLNRLVICWNIMVGSLPKLNIRR
ncbi:MAG: zincin-like metallopeptidase domain-containing protein [Anaerobutyricum sp.]